MSVILYWIPTRTELINNVYFCNVSVNVLSWNCCSVETTIEEKKVAEKEKLAEKPAAEEAKVEENGEKAENGDSKEEPAKESEEKEEPATGKVFLV